MTRCQCANERRPATKQFRWGGCSDNVKHGKRVARNFLELQAADGVEDESSAMLRHDSEVGIATVMGSLGEKCKCHGEIKTHRQELSQTFLCLFRCFGQLLDANMLAEAERFQHNVSCTTCEISSGSKENLFRESVTTRCKPRTSRTLYDWNRLQWTQLPWHRFEWTASGSEFRAAFLSRAIADFLRHHQRPTVSQPRQLFGAVLRSRLHNEGSQACREVSVSILQRKML